jgi:hypothetical protein
MLMKKIIPFTLGALLLFAGLSIPLITKADNNLVPYKISIKGDYYRDRYVDSVILHYGVNGWQDIKDVKMETVFLNYPNDMYYQATVYVPKNSTIDYAIKYNVGSMGTHWDNNGGKDYHIEVGNGNVDTVTYTIEIGDTYLKSVDEYVANGSEEEILPYKVTLRYGINGWKNPRDIEMTRVCYKDNDSVKEIVYKATITVAKEDVIDFAYHVDRSVYNEPSKWYNNNGADWHVSQETANSAGYFFVSCED